MYVHTYVELNVKDHLSGMIDITPGYKLTGGQMCYTLSPNCAGINNICILIVLHASPGCIIGESLQGPLIYTLNNINGELLMDQTLFLFAGLRLTNILY